MSVAEVTSEQFIAGAIDRLRAERLPVAARLDSIDLAIANLQQLLPRQRPGEKSARPRTGPEAEKLTAARRREVLKVLRKHAAGLTKKELRSLTPDMASKDRANTLQALKGAGQIVRTAKGWKVADA